MEGEISKVAANNIDSNMPTYTPPSKLKTYGFALAIILGIGALTVAGIGLGGYLKIGSFSNLGQVKSILMMTLGVENGVLFIAFGVAGLVKDRNKAEEMTQVITFVEFPLEGWDRVGDCNLNRAKYQIYRDKNNNMLYGAPYNSSARQSGFYKSERVNEINKEDSVSSPCIKVIVKKAGLETNGHISYFSLNEDALVEDLEGAIKARWGIQSLHLLFCGKKLEGGRKLSSYMVKNDSIVSVQFPLLGGSS